MPSIATKLAPKLPVTKTALAKPQSLLIAPDENLLEDTETIRRTVAGLAAGEGCDDPAAYRAAAIRRGFTPILEAFAIEAVRTIGDLNLWPDEFSERLASLEADEVKWRKAETEADLALTKARQQRRAAQHDRENLLGENRQVRHLIDANPFLCGDSELAAQHIATPALTRNECAAISGLPHQPWEMEQARTRKIYYAEREASGGK